MNLNYNIVFHIPACSSAFIGGYPTNFVNLSTSKHNASWIHGKNFVCRKYMEYGLNQGFEEKQNVFFDFL